MTGTIPRDFLRGSMLDSGAVAPASVVRVRPTVRTADSIPAVGDMILFGLMVVTIEVTIIEASLPSLRANRGNIELLIRAAANEFGAIDDPDPVRRRNLRYSGMYLERRPPPSGTPILRVSFSGKSGRSPGIMSSDKVPFGVTSLRQVIENVVRGPAVAIPDNGNWAPTLQLREAMNVLLEPSFGYHAEERQAARVLPFDPQSPLDPP